MAIVEIMDLLNAGAHFGHLTRRWNPKMREYIFMERNGIHIIDLKKTQHLLTDARNAIERFASEGRKILFIGTKKQAREIIKTHAERVGANYVIERWLGGMLTNFSTIRKSIKRLNIIDKMELDGCLLYTSDAADERSSVDLGGRRIIKKKNIKKKKRNKKINPL